MQAAEAEEDDDGAEGMMEGLGMWDDDNEEEEEEVSCADAEICTSVDLDGAVSEMDGSVGEETEAGLAAEGAAAPVSHLLDAV